MAVIDNEVGLDFDNYNTRLIELETYLEEFKKQINEWNSGFDGVLSGFEGKSAEALKDFKTTISESICKDISDILKDQIARVTDYKEILNTLD